MSRKVKWKVDNPKKESTLYSQFPEYLIEAHEQEGVALHNHNFSILTETFEKHPQLNAFYNILGTDVING